MIHRQPTLVDKTYLSLSVVASVVALLIYNFHSSDIYSYISPGWQQVRYHVNPYVTLINETPNFGTDPLLTKVWSDNPMPYGFLFAHYVKLVTSLGMGNLLLTFCLFKVVNLMAFFAVSVLIYFGCKRMHGQGVPNAALAFHLFAWSPLALLQVLSNAHNDILMAMFTLAGFIACTTVMPGLSMPLIAVGSLVKYVWFYSLPFLALYLWRKKGVGTMLISATTAAAALTLCSMPYIMEIRNFRWAEFSANLHQQRSSLLSAVHDLSGTLNHLLFHDSAAIASGADNLLCGIKYGLLALFATFTARHLIKSIFDRSYLTLEKVIDISVFATTMWICVINEKFFCWYLMMVFPVALLLPEGNKTRTLLILLSCTHVLGLTFIGQSHIADFLVQTGLPLVGWMWYYKRKSAQVESRHAVVASNI